MPNSPNDQNFSASGLDDRESSEHRSAGVAVKERADEIPPGGEHTHSEDSTDSEQALEAGHKHGLNGGVSEPAEHDYDHHEHDHVEHHRMMMVDFYRRFWVSLALSVPIILLSPMIQGWLGLKWLAFPGSQYVQLGLATLIDVMLLGHWIEMKSVLGASSALNELTRLLPADAHRLDDDGDTHDVAISELGKDDRVVVKPGERIPIDGTILDGRTSIDESMLTGESVPVSRSEGDEVVGGSVNQEGAIVVEVAKTGNDTYLSQVVRTVREAQESKSRQQDLADRVAAWLAYVAITAGAITFVAWLIAGDGFSFAMERMVTVMVITCPHALGLAVPLVVGVSTALAARRGLLIRRRSAFELARKLDAVVFDKTGTLTEGRFAVRDTVPLSDESEEDVLRLAAALESRSEHPIAAAIVAHAEDERIRFSSPSDFQNIAEFSHPFLDCRWINGIVWQILNLLPPEGVSQTVQVFGRKVPLPDDADDTLDQSSLRNRVSRAELLALEMMRRARVHLQSLAGLLPVPVVADHGVPAVTAFE